MAQFTPAAQQQPESTQVLLRSDSGSLVQRTVLGNGLRIITEAIPGSRSAVFGVWVGAGSRDEDPAQHGAAHYLEHLLFKATARRSAFEVNAAIDAIGGEMNAFTSRETTCFYTHVRAADLPVASDVVLDVVTAPLMRDADVDSERQVVLEEIAMHEDDPGDVGMEQFHSRVIGDASLGRSILGTPQGIEDLPADLIRSFYRDHYRPEAMVVAVSGAIDHRDVLDLVRSGLTASGWGAGRAVPTGVRPAAALPQPWTAPVVVRRPSEQAHILIGGPSLPRNDPDKYALAVFNTVLGGGMSSRLFHRVREERGLAYSVYSFSAPYTDAGVFGVYAGTRPQKADEAIAVIVAELRAVAERGITPEELERGKGSVRGSRVLALEDPFARMNRLGHAELVVGELPSIDDIERRIESVTLDDVARVAHRLLDGPLTACVVGPMTAGWQPALAVR